MLNSGDNEIKHNATAFPGIEPEHYDEAEFSGNQALSYQNYINYIKVSFFLSFFLIIVFAGL